MKVKALKKYYYDKREILPGETFEMDDRQAGEARILATIGTLEILSSSEQQTQQAAPERVNRYEIPPSGSVPAEPTAETPPEEQPPSGLNKVMSTQDDTAPLVGGRRYIRRGGK